MPLQEGGGYEKNGAEWEEMPRSQLVPQTRPAPGPTTLFPRWPLGEVTDLVLPPSPLLDHNYEWVPIRHRELLLSPVWSLPMSSTCVYGTTPAP